MKLNHHLFGRLLCSVLLCCGLLSMNGCTDDLIPDDDTEQSGDTDNNGGSDAGGNTGDTSGVGGTVSDGAIVLTLSASTATTATFKGTADLDQLGDYSEFGLAYSTEPNINIENSETIRVTSLNENRYYSYTATDLIFGTKYYYTYYKCKAGVYSFGEVISFTTSTPELSLSVSDITATTATLNISGSIDPADAAPPFPCISFIRKPVKNSHTPLHLKLNLTTPHSFPQEASLQLSPVSISIRNTTIPIAYAKVLKNTAENP